MPAIDATAILKAVDAAFTERIAADAVQTYINDVSGQGRVTALAEFERGLREKIAMHDLVMARLQKVLAE